MQCNVCRNAVDSSVKYCPYCGYDVNCNTDEVERCLKDGIGYFYGSDGYPNDYARAYNCLSRAAQAGDAEAKNCIGLMYLNGLYVKKDVAYAERIFQDSASNVIPCAYAFYNLGCIRMSNRQYQAAEVLFKKALETDESIGEAWYQLYYLYSNCKCNIRFGKYENTDFLDLAVKYEVPQALEIEAKRWFANACQLVIEARVTGSFDKEKYYRFWSYATEACEKAIAKGYTPAKKALKHINFVLSTDLQQFNS